MKIYILLLSVFMASLSFGAPIKKLDGKVQKDGSIVYKVWQGRDMPGEGAKNSIKISGNPNSNNSSITNVSVPDIRFFKAQSDKPMPAIIIAPGGAYEILSYGMEGTEFAKFLNKYGISAFVLKYRVPKNREGAACDAQRALRFVRAYAKEFNVNPSAVGMGGFSAGGHLTCYTSSHYKDELYPHKDFIDKLSARPDFLVLIYPAYTGSNELVLQPDVPVSAETTPPCFLVQAMDDGYLKDGLTYFLALKKARLNVEAHFFERGGHGFGMRGKKETTRDSWPQMLINWLATHKLTSPRQ